MRKFALFLAWWAPVSLVAGIACCYIPWGEPTMIHGTGVPIPSVIWDKPPGSEVFFDYVNPLALGENPLLVMFAGIIVWAVYQMIRRLTARAHLAGGAKVTDRTRPG